MRVSTEHILINQSHYIADASGKMVDLMNENVVEAACLESRRLRVRSPLWHQSFKETKKNLLRSLVKIEYYGELP